VRAEFPPLSPLLPYYCSLFSVSPRETLSLLSSALWTVQVSKESPIEVKETYLYWLEVKETY
jgi:hypothetical protein